MAPVRSTARAERLLDLVSLFLGASAPIGWSELVEAFPADYGEGEPESCQRKWERDKKELLELGIPLRRVVPGEDGIGGWVVDRARYYMGDLELDTEERTLLSVAGAAALSQPDFPLRADLAHALDKLLFDQPAGARPLARRLAPQLPVRGAERAAGILEALGRALADRSAVRIRYRAFSGESSEREVRPYGLAYRRGAWFLVGHCLLRDGLRTFQVERIAAVEAVGPRPAYEIPGGFDVGEVVGREPWEFAVHAPVEATLRLDAQAAILARGRFGSRATILPLADGGAEVRLFVTYGDALAREILRLAPHARLLSPPELRQAVEAKATAIAALHGERDTESADTGTVPAERESEPLAGESAQTQSEPGPEGGSVLAQGEPGPEGGSVLAQGEPGPGGGESLQAKREVQRVAGKTKSGAHAAGLAGPSELQERLRRALFLIPYAAARSGCTLRDLAEAVRLGEEELLAELDFLRMVGRPPFSPADLIDIDVYDGRVHVALPQGLLKPPSLTPLEAAALDAAATALESVGGEVLSRARDKLRAAIDPAARERFDRVSGRLVLDQGSLAPEVVSIVDEAISARRELELTYWTASRGEATRRVLRPLERVLHQGYWYLYAWCTTRRERRLFRLDRAADLVLLDRTFLPRRDEGEVRFSHDSLHDPAAGRPLARVRVEPGPWADPGLVERMGGRDVRRLADGSVEAAFPAGGDAFVVSTVLSFGGAASLEVPAELRDRTRLLAEQTARAHSEL